ncbi:MAG: hypothetical protein AAF806_02780 [Bacteroidota bacterium]
MKLALVLFFCFTITSLHSQEINYLEGSYILENINTGSITRIELEDNNFFQYMIDDRFDCTPAFIMYGKGKYKILEDSIHLAFDSIPSLKSESQLDSIPIKDDSVNVFITVVDETNQLLDDATLRWGKPKRKGRWLTTEFFQKQFDGRVALKLKVRKELNFVSIEREGYHSCTIDIPRNPSNNYGAKAIMRAKPRIAAKYYISNETLILKLLSECEIELNNESVLRKKDCE